MGLKSAARSVIILLCKFLLSWYHYLHSLGLLLLVWLSLKGTISPSVIITNACVNGIVFLFFISHDFNSESGLQIFTRPTKQTQRELWGLTDLTWRLIRKLFRSMLTALRILSKPADKKKKKIVLSEAICQIIICLEAHLPWKHY